MRLRTFLTAFAGAAMALVQHHLKRMLAFATVAYIGLFMVGIATLSAEGVGAAGAVGGGSQQRRGGGRGRQDGGYAGNS